MSEQKVRCVAGDIEPSSLGFTDIHEHPFVFPMNGVSLPDGFIIDDYSKTFEEAASFIEAGGGAVVDAQPFGAGRHPELQLQLSQETGLNIIASTGCHLRFFYPAATWWDDMDAAEVADLFISEIEEGMYAYDPEDPLGNRTSIKAGIIKISTDENGVAGFYEKIFLAAAAAQRKTGVPIITHSASGPSGYGQAQFLIKEGVSPDRIIISHMDRTIDYDVTLKTAALGCCFSLDTIARYQYHDDKDELALINTLIESGYTGQILLGLDCTLDRYAAHGGKPGYAFLPGVFPGLMEEAGIPQEVIHTITIQNPRDTLSF